MYTHEVVVPHQWNAQDFFETRKWLVLYAYTKISSSLRKQGMHLLKNRQAVKKVRPYLRWPVWKKLWNQKRNGFDGIDWWHNLNNNNPGQFVLPHLILTIQESEQNSPELLLNFLQSIYTVTVNSWPLLWFHNFFHSGHFKQGRTFFTISMFLSRFNLYFWFYQL